jgi:CHAT domain-containing protein/Tfp pilus assembly protein PilF
MIYKRYSLFCFLLLAGTILPMVNERGFSLMPSVMAQSGDIKTLLQQALQYTQAGNPQQAIKILQQVLKLSQQQGDKKNEGLAHLGLGFNYDNIGQPQPALVQNNQALLIFQEIKDRRLEARILNNIGAVYLRIGKPEEALKYFNQALPISRAVGDRSGEATTLNNIGEVYRGIGEPEEALKYYNQALPIVREVGDRSGEARTLSNIGLVYDGIGKPEEALKYYNQVLPISREVGDHGGEAATLNNIGLVYLRIGKPEEALKYFNQALPISREVGDRRMEATTLSNIGNFYLRIGKPEEALKYYNQALPISREVGDRGGEAITLSNIGAVYDVIGKPEKALKYYNQALPIRREVGDRGGEATTLNNIGAVYWGMGKPEEALKYYNQALPIRREVGDRGGEATTLSNIGLVYRDTNQPANAITNFEASAEITLNIRGGLTRGNRAAFINDKRGTAISLIDLLIRQNQPEKAYQWANRFTTFELANYNLLINAKVANPTAQTAIDNWNQQQQTINFLRQQLKDNYSPEKARQLQTLEAESFKQAEAIAKTYPEAAELFETKATDIQQLRQNIAADTLVIHPVLLTNTKNVPNAIALFLLTRQQLKVIVIPVDPQKLDQLLQSYKSQLNGDFKNATDFINISSQLYNLLIRPIDKQIQTLAPKKLAIITTGKLRGIPFESLYDEKADQYLIEKYPIHYLTRISTAKLFPQSSQPDLKILAIANPRPTKIDLPGTEQQANYITQNFPNSQQYSREQATLTTFKDNSPKFPILHLGTHGCFQSQGCPTLNMEANTLLFANGEKYNIADAALLGLKDTQLIVFSACQTAKEIDENDQSLPGLAYIFERAGAKSIIATLWNSEDNTSVEIMSQFYANLKQGMSKSEALQKAKLSQIKRHPAFWSVFILIGED